MRLQVRAVRRWLIDRGNLTAYVHSAAAPLERTGALKRRDRDSLILDSDLS
jgi:hypothetical protein